MSRLHPDVFFARRARLRRKMANMRASKERRRLERIAAGWTPEPKFQRHYPFEVGVRVKATGETEWHDLVSVRHAAKALGLVLKYYNRKWGAATP